MIMEDRDAHAGLQLVFDVEAFRRLDVLQVYAPEGRFERRDNVHKASHLALGHLDVEDIDAGELLEEDGFALHHGLRGERPDIAQPEHRRAVRHDSNEILAGGQIGGLGRVGRDRLAGGGDPGCVGQRQVTLVAERLRRLNLDLTGPWIAVVEQRARPQVVRHIRHRSSPP
jgi:hypothetical protein